MNFFKFFISISICMGTGALAGFLTSNATQDWYQTIAKPSIVPPGWVFPVVWNFLFFLMGVALFLIWEKGKESPFFRKAIWIFALQLFLNFLWSIIFFGYQRPGLALIEIFILWASILFSIIYFYKVDRVAGYLLIPYILWVSFAICLNFLIWRLN
jgi:benzodiazapine receptor